MVEGNSNITYSVKVIKHDVVRDYAEYLVKIVAPNGISFHIKDRYSSIRAW